MLKIGLSTCSKTLDEDLFKSYKTNGIEYMEISPQYDEYKGLDYSKIKKYADAYDIKLWSFHMPFLPFKEIDISSVDKTIRNNTFLYISELIKKGSDIGIDKFVVHPSAEPIDDEIRQDRINCAKECLSRLAEVACGCGSVIAVENLPRTCLGNCSEEILDLISVNSKLRVCFDTNHLLKQEPKEFVEAIGDKIVTLHVSDYDFVNERHWLPGEGRVDWAEMLKSIYNTGYRGPWLYEIGFECPANIIRDRALNCADFALNAQEIFEGKKLTVFSKQKENLGFSNK